MGLPVVFVFSFDDFGTHDTKKKQCAHCISDEVKKGSVAAGAICMWIHSVYKYAEIYNQVAPKLAKLMGAEEQVNKVRNEEEFG